MTAPQSIPAGIFAAGCDPRRSARGNSAVEPARAVVAACRVVGSDAQARETGHGLPRAGTAPRATNTRRGCLLGRAASLAAAAHRTAVAAIFVSRSETTTRDPADQAGRIWEPRRAVGVGRGARWAAPATDDLMAVTAGRDRHQDSPCGCSPLAVLLGTRSSPNVYGRFRTDSAERRAPSLNDHNRRAAFMRSAAVVSGVSP